MALVQMLLPRMPSASLASLMVREMYLTISHRLTLVLFLEICWANFLAPSSISNPNPNTTTGVNDAAALKL
jgi:hypothetical protein